MAIALGTALAISAAAGAGATVVSGIAQSKAGSKAAQVQGQAAADALAYTKQKDAQERADALAAQKANYTQWVARERRMAPYRASGQEASNTIAGLLGLPAVQMPEPEPPPAYLNGAGTTAAAAPQASPYVGSVRPITEPELMRLSDGRVVSRRSTRLR